MERQRRLRDAPHGKDPILTKRDSLRFCGHSLCALSAVEWLGFPRTTQAQAPVKGLVKTKLSPYFTSLEGGEIRCELCPRRCRVAKGNRGACRVRENREGKYYSLVYGNPCAVHLDPIEKKPFFHILPGSLSFSIATAGCNLHCKFCQNWEISQARPEKTYNFDLPPAKVVAAARGNRCRSIAHTYVEPIIFFEYMRDVGRLAKPAGVLNLCHSAGYINAGPLEELAGLLDGACIDLKAFDGKFYRELVDA